MPEPEYSIQKKACRRHGFCTHCATLTHRAAHKAHIFQSKLAFPLKNTGLNAGDAKVPLLRNNSWHLARKTCHQKFT
ncbi:MAG: hypothetical protein K2O92_08380, partial [Lachnospiraceae bacterium]|nr:hypothetical protein [Lachnospiraceae bacterium]